MGKIKEENYLVKNKKLTIRHAEIQDAEKLIELMNKLDVETTFLLREPDEFELSFEQEKTYIQSQQDSEVNVFIVAEIDGKIIGTCGINGNTRKRIRHAATLGVAIEKEFWGMGIGKKLMEIGIKWAKENGKSRITLEVDTENHRATSLYIKLGFEVEGTFRNDKILADGSCKNGYAMALLL